MKNKKLNIFILMLVIGLVLYFTLKDDFFGIISELSNINILIFILAILVFLISILFKSASLKVFINDYCTKYSLKKAFELTIIGQLLNGITPFQSGGQPFQIYLLKKDGIRITDSTNAMIKDFIAYQSALIIMGIFSIIANTKINVLSQNKYLNGLIFLGFSINVIVLIFLFLVSNAKKTGTKIIDKLINFVFKFKFMKKIGMTKEKAEESLNHFYETAKDVKKNKLSFVKGISYNIIHLILLYTIPFIIFISLSQNNINIMQSIVATAFVMLIGNFIPIPGATGGIEYSFLQFFGLVASGPILSSAMLLWRTVTYLFGMIVGFVALIFKKEVKEK